MTIRALASILWLSHLRISSESSEEQNSSESSINITSGPESDTDADFEEADGDEPSIAYSSRLTARQQKIQRGQQTEEDESSPRGLTVFI